MEVGIVEDKSGRKDETEDTIDEANDAIELGDKNVAKKTAIGKPISSPDDPRATDFQTIEISSVTVALSEETLFLRREDFN
mmetsp:Transcript_29879/g.62874  ORF Transcript_29879/g.62874 Transcript_29879/m.62874 type:complete len:81 (+) Transcript_29879:929-1171(+)